ncbi:acetate/propionate family kinase [Rhodobacter capsulatus]|uniref:acetate/propionate family kinase n=1 Tax=Rhodobacter capsulatus TaxID=1061 RepID=UPI0006DCC235|nr:acetate/propionate family kinase [Rhodobacter capsulatus]KQB11504.1 acetate kinase [Rhodobacter capsulatus]KQB12357.1 acetate kinase [Rhodobacter capsulatus]PZX25781.1 acetate kinase [Rhodobacter capsulatus]QNR64082.1 acetate/propionate family kinase [Rhodobacter capsulatus]
MTRAILTLNAGSSSLKLGLFDEELAPLATAHVDRLGAPEGSLKLKDAAGDAMPVPHLGPDDFATHTLALRSALGAFRTDMPELEIIAIGHRIVHGGTDHAEPEKVTDVLMDHLERLNPFAPLHQPHNLAGVRAAIEAFPGVPNVACFDTAFHRGHPFVDDTYALPRHYYEKGVRRYGFHGLSYTYIDGVLAAEEPELRAGRVVIAHLGSGASICAVHAGQSISCTMGFSTLSGLPMGTRAGELDAGVVLYLMDQEKMNAEDITELLFKRSGLIGMSGVSNDMRTLEASKSPHAAEAIDYFCHRVKREIASLAAAMGGMDALVFCGGVGENSSHVRAAVCEGLDWAGITLDEAANLAHAREISTGRVAVRVIPTNEEVVIAQAAKDALHL